MASTFSQELLNWALSSGWDKILCKTCQKASSVSTRSVQNFDPLIHIHKIIISRHHCFVTIHRCDDGQCITKSRRCDGVSDCDDGDDEARCTTTPDFCEYSLNFNLTIILTFNSASKGV